MKLSAPKLLPRSAKHVRELKLLGVLALLLLAALLGPFVAQPADYHHFADDRVLWNVPFAMDVLSNLPFALWGAVGLCLAWPWAQGKAGLPAVDVAQGRMAVLFFAGLVVTAACSSWYHLNPNDAGLAIDRCGMVVAFAGMLGLAAGGRISARAGAGLAAAVLLLGPLSVLAWMQTGSVAPWLVLQFGGMALVLWFAWLRPLDGALRVRWALVIVIYAVAKLLEITDHGIFEIAGHVVSGHTLKHLAASCAAWPLVSALLQQRRRANALKGKGVAGKAPKQGRIGLRSETAATH